LDRPARRSHRRASIGTPSLTDGLTVDSYSAPIAMSPPIG
jgi:hypothetical protein